MLPKRKIRCQKASPTPLAKAPYSIAKSLVDFQNYRQISYRKSTVVCVTVFRWKSSAGIRRSIDPALEPSKLGALGTRVAGGPSVTPSFFGKSLKQKTKKNSRDSQLANFHETRVFERRRLRIPTMQRKTSWADTSAFILVPVLESNQGKTSCNPRTEKPKKKIRLA